MGRGWTLLIEQMQNTVVCSVVMLPAELVVAMVVTIRFI